MCLVPSPLLPPVSCINVNKAVIMNMEYCYFHIIYLKKNVGADWTCTSAEYMVHILKKYILIDGSVLPTASFLGIPDIVILMFED